MAAIYGDFSIRAQGDNKSEKKTPAPEIGTPQHHLHTTQYTHTHTHKYRHSVNILWSVHARAVLIVHVWLKWQEKIKKAAIQKIILDLRKYL